MRFKETKILDKETNAKKDEPGFSPTQKQLRNKGILKVLPQIMISCSFLALIESYGMALAILFIKDYEKGTG